MPLVKVTDGSKTKAFKAATAEVLLSVASQVFGHGWIKDSDNVVLTPGYGNLTEGTYMWRANTGVQASTSVSGASDQVLLKLDKIYEAVAEHLSATIAASSIKKENVNHLLKAARCIIVCEDDHRDVLRKMLDRPATGFWDPEQTELKQQDRYAAEIQNHVPLPDHNGLEWRNALGTVVKRRFGAMLAPIAAKNDEVLVVKSLTAVQDSHGAVMGVELKVDLSEEDLLQGFTEYVLWGDDSNVPYVQVITDLMRGGVAWFHTGITEPSSGLLVITERVLPDMTSVWKFMNEVVTSTTPNIGRFVGDSFLLPSELGTVVKRARLDIRTPKGTAGSDEVVGILADLCNNVDDVSCLRDVAADPSCFWPPPHAMDPPLNIA